MDTQWTRDDNDGRDSEEKEDRWEGHGRSPGSKILILLPFAIGTTVISSPEPLPLNSSANLQYTANRQHCGTIQRVPSEIRKRKQEII
jgi:hypothetical protein